VFFESDRTVSARGAISDFRFPNPRGLIRNTTPDKDRKQITWRAETNSPSTQK